MGEPLRRRHALVLLVQLRTRSQIASRDARHGRWNQRSCLERSRTAGGCLRYACSRWRSRRNARTGIGKRSLPLRYRKHSRRQLPERVRGFVSVAERIRASAKTLIVAPRNASARLSGSQAQLGYFSLWPRPPSTNQPTFSALPMTEESIPKSGHTRTFT